MATVELEVSNPFAYNSKVTDFGEQSELFRSVLPYQKSSQDRPYIVKLDDNLEQIAHRFYKDYLANPGAYWWYIADANAELIDNPLDLSGLVGSQIIIPDPLRIGF